MWCKFGIWHKISPRMHLGHKWVKDARGRKCFIFLNQISLIKSKYPGQSLGSLRLSWPKLYSCLKNKEVGSYYETNCCYAKSEFQIIGLVIMMKIKTVPTWQNLSSTCNFPQIWIENSSFTCNFPQFCHVGLQISTTRVWINFSTRR